MIKRFFNTPVDDGSWVRWEKLKSFFWWVRPHFSHRPYGYTCFSWGAFGIHHERRYYRTSGLFLSYESFNWQHELEWRVFGYTQPEHKQRKLDEHNNAAMQERRSS